MGCGAGLMRFMCRWSEAALGDGAAPNAAADCAADVIPAGDA